MLKISEGQHASFEKLIKFLLRLQGIHFFPAKGDYYPHVASIMCMAEGSIKNTLYVKKNRCMSETKFDLFCDKFSNVISALPNRDQDAIDHIKIFDEWKSSVYQSNLVFNNHAVPKVLNATSRSNGGVIESIKSGNSKEIDLPQNILNAFNNSTWYCYERNEKHIGRKVIHFKSFDKMECDVTIESHDSRPWKGVGIYNEREQVLVIISENTGTNSDYTHFLILVDRIKNTFELCIGHVTYKHRRNQNIVTKAVLFLNSNLKQKAPKSPGILDLDSKEVAEEVREFFSDRKLNRLSSPHRIDVYNLATLRKWLNQNKPDPQNIYKPVIGNYRVFYKRKPDEGFLTASFQLCEVNGGVSAKLVRKIDENEVSTSEGVICFDIESHIMTALLNEINYDQTLSNGDIYTNKQTFILINLPDRSTKKIDTLIGIATGARDSNQGSVSRLMVFVKLINGKLPQNYNKKELENFFSYYKNQSWIRPPYSRKVPFIYNFNHLRTAREDSIKNYGENI